MPERLIVNSDPNASDKFGTCNYPYGGSSSLQTCINQLTELKAAGLGWMRTDFKWSIIQPSQNTFQWTNYDNLITAANQVGIKILPIICYGVSWANGGNADNYPPTGTSEFAAFAALVVNRYFPQGVKYYEIWNEPNISGFWQPAPDGVAYAQLLKASYTAIKAVQPGAIVISAGTAPSGTDATHTAPATFLQQIYTTIGNQYFDAVGHHPYGWLQPDSLAAHTSAESIVTALRNVMVANGDQSKKVWFTELGRPTGGQSSFSSEKDQSVMLQQTIREARQIPWVERVFVYNFKDSAAPSDTTDREGHFGMVHLDGTVKPSYTLVKDAIMNG